MTLLRLLVIIGCLLPATASAELGRPVLFTLGAAKLPGVAFDAVALARIAPHLGSFDAPVAGAARAAFGSNLATLVLHGVSIGSFWGAALADAPAARRVFVPAVINGVSDLSVAVMGVVTGVDLLVRVRAAGIGGTEPGIGALWSGWVNVVMGGFGAIWFLPMLGATVATLEDATAARPVILQLAIRPGGLAVAGRF